MKTILAIAASAALLASLAMPASAKFNPSGGTIKSGPIKPICSSNPKACGVGYDPLKRPHKTTTPH